MKRQPITLLVSSLVALTIAACSGGGMQSNPASNLARPPGNQPPAVQGTTATYDLPAAGGTFALPLPAGYGGTITLGANHGPRGNRLALNVSGPATSEAQAAKVPFTAAAPTDPFPIIIGLRLPFTITIPVPAFTIQFPRQLAITGTFDVDWFDPTQAESPPANPRLLGTATASGHTLSFNPPPHETLTLVGGVQYTLSVLRDVAGASALVLPVQSGVQQQLASVGPLGASALYQSSQNAGFLQWQTINGSPAGVQPLIFNDSPIESLVVTATQPLALLSTTITAQFTVASESIVRRPVMATATPTPTPAPGSFVPDANPTVVGPFPATVSGNQATFTASQPGGFSLGGNKAWNFSLVTVTVCVPINVLQPCDDGTSNNVQPSVSPNTQFDVLVADESGLLTQPYALSTSGSCTTAGVDQNDDNGDEPPGYNDNATGPKAEFDVLSTGQSGTCTISALYNGSQVAQTSIAVGGEFSRSSTAQRIRYTLRPPVNGPSGFGVSGKVP